MKNKKSMAIEKKRSWVGASFISIWVVGFLLFYIYPLIASLYYSFFDLTSKEFVGLKYFTFAFTKDQNFLKNLVTSLQVVVLDMPGIIIFSLIIALLLVNKFKGQGFFKVIFFLPFIMSSGIVMDFLGSDVLSSVMQSGERSGNTFQAFAMSDFLLNLGLTQELTTSILNLVSDIFGLVLKSGVQVLLFITGLNAISVSIYEAASIDGCTAWERFWKITFPLVAPIMLVNCIYTLTDSFTSDNPMIASITNQARATNYSLSSAMSWIFTVIIVLIIAIVYFIINRRISYAD